VRLRFLSILTLVCAIAGGLTAVARALDFDDEDPDPVVTEVGRVLEYKIGTHAGCLPHRVLIDNGIVPPGTELVQLDYQTAVVRGIPTEAGDYKVWLEVRDCENKSAQQLFEFVVGQRTYAIQTSSIPAATVGAPYSTKLVACCHPTRSEKWQVTKGSLAAGLALADDGTISGTPLVPGTSTFTVTATSIGDDGGVRIDSRALTLTVTGTFEVDASQRMGEVGVPFRSVLTANGGPYTWSASDLPVGLTLSADGIITGTPTKAGSATVSVRVTASNGAAADAQLVLVIRRHLAIATRSLRAATAGRAYHARVATTGGVAPLTWSLRGRLPGGLRFKAGRISGTPAATGRTRITLRVRDSLGAVAARALTVAVR
jgi:hypothetical protein